MFDDDADDDGDDALQRLDAFDHALSSQRADVFEDCSRSAALVSAGMYRLNSSDEHTASTSNQEAAQEEKEEAAELQKGDLAAVASTRQKAAPCSGQRLENRPAVAVSAAASDDSCDTTDSGKFLAELRAHRAYSGVPARRLRHTLSYIYRRAWLRLFGDMQHTCCTCHELLRRATGHAAMRIAELALASRRRTMADALAQLRITDPALLRTIRQHRVQVCDFFLCQLLSRAVPSNRHSGRSLSVST